MTRSQYSRFGAPTRDSATRPPFRSPLLYHPRVTAKRDSRPERTLDESPPEGFEDRDSGAGTPGQRGSRRGSRWFAAVFLLLLAGVTVLLAELTLRLQFREEEVNGNYWGIGAFEASETLGFRHRPGFSGFATRPGVFRTSVRINRFGLRQGNLDEQLQYPNTLLLLGDSFTFGLGVEEEEAFASLIQPDLNARGIGVLNAAQTGYSVEQELHLGTLLVPELEPEVILLCLYAQNDIRGDYEKRYRNIDVAYGYRLPKDRRFPGPTVDFFRTHSYLWKLTSGRFNQHSARSAAASFFERAQARTEEVMQPSLRALRRLHDFSRS